MLQSIKDILRKMGDGLAFANAGELLSGEQKTRVLSRYENAFPAAPDAPPPRVVLAGDEVFAGEAVDRAIALCHEKQAMLDLLWVSPEGNQGTIHLDTMLPRLESETGLDFQVTRRYGELPDVVENYLRSRRDILKLLISVSERLRRQAELHRRTERWSLTSRLPGVELIDEAAHA
jgi:hypothetical protein